MHVDALWEALEMTARSPEKLMDVIDVTPPDKDCVLFCGMTTKAKDTIMKE